MRFRIEKKGRRYVLYVQTDSGWEVVGRYATSRGAEVAMAVRYNQQ